MVTCLRSVKEEDVALRGIEVPNAWRRLRKVCEQLHTLQVHTASHLTGTYSFTLQVHKASHLTGKYSFTPYRYIQLHTLQVHTASHLTGKYSFTRYRYKQPHTLQVESASHYTGTSSHYTGTNSLTPYR